MRALYAQVPPDYIPPKTVPQQGASSRREVLANLAMAQREIAERQLQPTSLELDQAGKFVGRFNFEVASLEELKGLVDNLYRGATDAQLYKGRMSFAVNSAKDSDRLLNELRGGTDEKKSGLER